MVDPSYATDTWQLSAAMAPARIVMEQTMTLSFVELFFLSFLLVALGYGVLAGWTTILLRNKSLGQLRGAELRVKQGTASLEHRLNILVKTFFSSLFTYQVYLLALLVSGLLSLIFRYLPR